MGRHIFLEASQLTVEGQAQALRHAKDAVDRSAWFLAMVRRDLAKGPGIGTPYWLEARRALADLENRQFLISTAYDGMAATSVGGNSMELKSLFLAYDEFLDAVHAARMAQYSR